MLENMPLRRRNFKTPRAVPMIKTPRAITLLERLCAVVIEKTLRAIMLLKRLCAVLIIKRPHAMLIIKRLTDTTNKCKANRCTASRRTAITFPQWLQDQVDDVCLVTPGRHASTPEMLEMPEREGSRRSR